MGLHIDRCVKDAVPDIGWHGVEIEGGRETPATRSIVEKAVVAQVIVGI
jgi:hypothetical protein